MTKNKNGDDMPDSNEDGLAIVLLTAPRMLLDEHPDVKLLKLTDQMIASAIYSHNVLTLYKMGLATLSVEEDYGDEGSVNVGIEEQCEKQLYTDTETMVQAMLGEDDDKDF